MQGNNTPSATQPLVPIPLPSPTGSERSLAATMHIASIFFPILAPAIAYVISGNAKFLRAHAYQAIFETVVLKVSVFVVGVISLIYTATSLWHHYQTNWENFSFWPMLARFAIGFILLAILEVFNTIVSILQASQALHGQWPKREVRRQSVIKVS